MEGDALAGKAIDAVLDGIAVTGEVAGEGAEAHARTAEALEFGEVEEALGVVVD